MQVDEYSYTGVGSTRIHVVSSPSDAVASPRADVLIVHGWTEHSGRFFHVANALGDAGYDTHLYDHRGHGRSGGKPGHVDSVESLVDDAAGVVELVFRRRRDPKRPFFVVAHSLGAMTVLIATERGLIKPDCIAVTGTPVVPNARPLTDRQRQTIISIGRLLPTVPVAAPLNRANATRDPEINAWAVKDPFCFSGRPTLGTGAQMFYGSDQLRKGLASIAAPILFLHGSKDALAKPYGSSLAYELVSSKDKRIKIYEGLMHHLFLEPERADVIADVVDWFDKHSAPADVK